MKIRQPCFIHSYPNERLHANVLVYRTDVTYADIDESSLDQFSANSLLMFSLSWSKIGTIFVLRRIRSKEENIQWDCVDKKTMSLDEIRDMTMFSTPNFLSHVSKFEKHRVLNY